MTLGRKGTRKELGLQVSEDRRENKKIKKASVTGKRRKYYGNCHGMTGQKKDKTASSRNKN